MEAVIAKRTGRLAQKASLRGRTLAAQRYP